MILNVGSIRFCIKMFVLRMEMSAFGSLEVGKNIL